MQKFGRCGDGKGGGKAGDKTLVEGKFLSSPSIQRAFAKNSFGAGGGGGGGTANLDGRRRPRWIKGEWGWVGNGDL